MAANAGYCHSPRSVTSFPDGNTHSRETYPNHLQQRAARRRAAPRGSERSQLVPIARDSAGPPRGSGTGDTSATCSTQGRREVAFDPQWREAVLDLSAARELAAHLRLAAPRGGERFHLVRMAQVPRLDPRHIYAWQHPGEARGLILVRMTRGSAGPAVIMDQNKQKTKENT